MVEEKFPQHITPASTIVKAFNMFLDDDSLSGKVAECVLENVHFRDPHPVRAPVSFLANQCSLPNLVSLVL